MASYQICFISETNSVLATEEFNAPNDQAAIVRARKMFHGDVGKGYELWQGERHFHSECHQGASASDHRNLDMTLPLGFILKKSPK